MAQITMAALPALKETFTQLKSRMDKAVEAFRKELVSQRTGRANVHMLDSIHVDAYGSMCRSPRSATSAPRSRNSSPLRPGIRR